MPSGLIIDDTGVATVDEFVAALEDAHAAGFGRIWVGQHQNWDILSLLAAAGPRVPHLEFGTAIVPTYPRHPMMLASQALTVQAVTGNRLTLGVGVSHRPIVEGMFGYDADRPARHLREYLSVLMPLLAGESVEFSGETVSASGAVSLPGASAPDVLVAALGPVMLRLAAELAQGTVTMWAGPRVIEEYVIPTMASARGTSVPSARVVAGVGVCVTDDVESARAAIGRDFAIAGQLENYRAIMERQGVDRPEELAVVGDEDEVLRQLASYRDAGADEVAPFACGPSALARRTREALASTTGRW